MRSLQSLRNLVSLGRCKPYSVISINQLTFRKLNSVNIKQCSSFKSGIPIAGPLYEWEKLANESKIKRDAHQREIVKQLQEVYESLQTYQPQVVTVEETSSTVIPKFLKSFWNSSESEEDPKAKSKRLYDSISGVPRGVYLYGDVGCGKTFVMDLLYFSCANNNAIKRKRVHFHKFMLDVHHKMHLYRKKHARADPIPPLATELANEAWLLCFDEFQVTDVADASILHRLFKALYLNGVVVIATSNRPPKDLYKNGLQRELFLPFIDLLMVQNRVLCLNSGIDYRLSGTTSTKVYNYPLNEETASSLNKLFHDLTHGEKVTSQTITTDDGRTLMVPKTARGVAWFTFKDLCEKPLGSSDYIAISHSFHTVILSNIPILNAWTQFNQIRRFINLVDELYNYKVKLICSAAASPQELMSFADTQHFGSGSKQDAKSAVAGEEERFMWSRVVSRLVEMQSEEYLQAAHQTQLGDSKHKHQ